MMNDAQSQGIGPRALSRADPGQSSPQEVQDRPLQLLRLPEAGGVPVVLLRQQQPPVPGDHQLDIRAAHVQPAAQALLSHRRKAPQPGCQRRRAALLLLRAGRVCRRRQQPKGQGLLARRGAESSAHPQRFAVARRGKALPRVLGQGPQLFRRLLRQEQLHQPRAAGGEHVEEICPQIVPQQLLFCLCLRRDQRHPVVPLSAEGQPQAHQKGEGARLLPHFLAQIAQPEGLSPLRGGEGFSENAHAVSSFTGMPCSRSRLRSRAMSW